MQKEQIYRFLNKHNKNRILFGTDFPVGNPKENIELIKSLNIKKDFFEKIMHVNAEHLLKIK